jgi:hypothetical protein
MGARAMARGHKYIHTTKFSAGNKGARPALWRVAIWRPHMTAPKGGRARAFGPIRPFKVVFFQQYWFFSINKPIIS